MGFSRLPLSEAVIATVSAVPTTIGKCGAGSLLNG